MTLTIYKGFALDFIENINKKPLIDIDKKDMVDVLRFDKKIRVELEIALISLSDEDDVWITYEEYSLIKNRVDEAIKEDGLKVVLIKNNIYPDYYPIPFSIDENLIDEIVSVLNGSVLSDITGLCKRFFKVYNEFLIINGAPYGSFYNYEYDRESVICLLDYYNSVNDIENTNDKWDYNVFLNDDIKTYLCDLANIAALKPSIVAVKSASGYISKRMQASLQSFCALNHIKLVEFHENISSYTEIEECLYDIAKNDIGIAGFEEFRKIKFYKNPDIDKSTVEISQGQIIQEIIRQAESSYNEKKFSSFRDIFITASTGAGKSVMFQVPAVYLAKKYHKLTIIIEPVKALMQDQKEKLNKSGYNRVEVFNSDLISQVEKDAVLKKIKSGDVDILYLSPETLLSYSIEMIIGEREIGLLIVDEAHIVTTWGVGFRPDYWYLGSYINQLRNQIQTTKGMHRKRYRFPICAFTATAINGGEDDSVSDTIVSLYMENPIKYIGYVRRDDIKFDITHSDQNSKLPMALYNEKKSGALDGRLKKWLNNNEKTIVYFPYASLADDASKGIRSFAGITTDERIGVYTGRNVNELNVEIFNDSKRETFEKFRKGVTPIMFATKAFGMGVDVDDVVNVYHYAMTGNLCDYVQEVGRAARKKSLTGTAIVDCFPNDITFMNVLFGLSQIKHYQIKAVLTGIYEAYVSKKQARSFLISPESFTYIFNSSGVKAEEKCINKLKTCLLMLEKDFYDKYNFKVIVSRPQSVFTKAFVCIEKEHENDVLKSKYGDCFKFVDDGREREKLSNGCALSDVGDIYYIDLKRVWEQFYPNISFPQFKYWYFNSDSIAKDKIVIMPEIRNFFFPRQKVNIEVRGDEVLRNVKKLIFEDFEYVANTLYAEFSNRYFTTEDAARAIKDKYGIAKARIITNSLFELVDPLNRCVKRRSNDTSGKSFIQLSNGNFKEIMRRPIIKSKLIGNCFDIESNRYSSYVSLISDETSTTALKLLSIFGYINYEVVGGEEPEIFIRLNDPNKIKSIVMGNTFYSNDYVTKAKIKHERDVEIMLHFFNDLTLDEERWNYIENYFLGRDILSNVNQGISLTKMSSLIDKEHSYSTSSCGGWGELCQFFDENENLMLKKIIDAKVKIPEYIQTEIKKSAEGNDILMSWPSVQTLICKQDTSDVTMKLFKARGWNAFKIDDIDNDEIIRLLK